jgi:hypothetical protein
MWLFEMDEWLSLHLHLHHKHLSAAVLFAGAAKNGAKLGGI